MGFLASVFLEGTGKGILFQFAENLADDLADLLGGRLAAGLVGEEMGDDVGQFASGRGRHGRCSRRQRRGRG